MGDLADGHPTGSPMPFEVMTFGRSRRGHLPAADRRRAGGRRRPSASTWAARRPTWPWPRLGWAAAPRSSPASATTRSAATSAGRCATWRSTTGSWSPTPSTPPRSPSARSSRRTTSRSTSTASRPPRTCRSSPDDIDFDAVRATALMWLSVTGLSEEPSRERPPRGAGGPGPQAVHGAGPGLSADVLGRCRRRPPSRCRRCCPRSPWPSATGRSARSRSVSPSRSGRPTRCSTPGSSWPWSSRARRACSPRPGPSGSHRRRSRSRR